MAALACAAILAGAAHVQTRGEPWRDAEIAELAGALSEAWTHGLDPSRYADADALTALPRGPERDRMAREAWFALASDLAFGQVDPRRLDADWTAPRREIDLLTHYAEAREGKGIYASLEALAPAHPDYEALRRELIRRTISPTAPVTVPRGARLRRGEEGPRVDALRARLHQLGLIDTPGAPGEAFDARLETALMRFQARHNLSADGVLGDDTLTELNAGNGRRVDQLRANLERWRWLPADLGERHIRVNIADYRLEAWANGRAERVHQAQIGARWTSTPVFSEEMRLVEINPWWYTPMSLGEPWLRRFRTNPASAYANGYHLVDLHTGQRVDAHSADWANRRYRVIQQPGPNNAMGQVKFLFPNIHNVYIHDTPHQSRFLNTQRDDSAGCVRVREPVELAIWVLAAEGWSPAEVRAAFDARQTRRVRLTHRIPVHILYFTAVADGFGQVRYVHDVYRRDNALIRALDGDLPPLPAAPRAPAEIDENAQVN
ncbi:L,D-transpeptidase family protein [Alkalicaulis satelles]|uniref:L,D-transpeptidase family protein n=2 Tax=Alkalicaulis satelles TaxID=2609175 RepID=A0A5M6ZL46_9PROT|nr:L,D-transpeptidase family protein [Alkalicaulis satelles]